MNMLQTESLTYRQGNFLLSDVSLACAAGECLALLGPSGAGKSTCLEIMAGLRRATSGQVFIDGRDVTHIPPEQREVSYLPQDVALFPHLSVLENIQFPARMRGATPNPKRLREICAMLGILPLLDRQRVSSLSGGEAQRVAIARAYIVPPKVLFLDECFGSLDAPLRRRLSRQFRDLRRMMGTTTVLITHDIGEACLMADRLAVLHQGKLQQMGTPDELHRRPRTLQVAELLGVHNLLRVDSSRREGDHWRCSVGGFELRVPLESPTASHPKHLGFFAWDLVPCRSTKGHDTRRDPWTNQIRVCVVDSIRQGPVWMLQLSTEREPRIVLEALWSDPADSRVRPVRGDILDVAVSPEHIRSWSNGT